MPDTQVAVEVKEETIVVAGSVELTTTELAIQEEEKQMADKSYELLRGEIATWLKIAIESGNTLLTQKPMSYDAAIGAISYTPIAYDLWLSALPDHAQQHYNCSHCRTVWDDLFNIVVMDTGGALSFPAVQAFLTFRNDPVISKIFTNAPGGAEAFITYLKTIGSIAGRIYFPLPKIDLNLSMDRTSGGFNHFAAAPEEVIVKYNDEHMTFNDFKYIDTLFDKFINKDLNTTTLDKLFKYVKVELSKDTTESMTAANTALDRATDLLAVINQTRLLEKTRRMGIPYLWSCMQVKKNDWLRHVGNSVLNIVIDGYFTLKDHDNMEEGLVHIKRLLSTAMAVETYKVKTAEAPLASLEQAYKFLVESGYQNTLKRRLMLISEVESIVWKETLSSDLEVQGTGKEENTETDTELENIFKEMSLKKDHKASIENKLSGLLDSPVGRKSCSIQTFVETLDTIQSLSLNPAGNSFLLIPFFCTTAVGEGEHDELLNFDTRIGKYASGLMSSVGYTYSTIQQIARNGETPGSPDAPQLEDIPVTAIFTSKPGAVNDGETECNHVLNITNVGSNFQLSMVQHGSCILGSMIKSEFYGMSGPLVEMSKKFELVATDRPNTAGGVYLVPGAVLNVKYKDGSRELVQLTSFK